MIGIDHNLAEVEQRELFSFTKKTAAEAMLALKEEPGISGCVLIVTCNRMELYVHGEEEKEPLPLLELLCRFKGAKADECRSLFVGREGIAAVRHLFYLAAGLESKILGEDQILTQVKDALALAREVYAADTVLEVLFRQAVTAGKKIKTRVPMDRENFSAAHLALEHFKEMGFLVQGKKCMVIGNGMMGKITALALKDAGADVTVTVRQYKSGVVEIPEGCGRIHYGDRYELLKECDLVCSATASPNVTIDAGKVKESGIYKPMIFVDLAVPRDIDPAVRNLPGVKLYDIDDFSIDRRSARMKEQYAAAAKLLDAAVEEYRTWLECRDLIPSIQKIGAKTAEDILWRLAPGIKKCVPEETAAGELRELSAAAAQKSVNRLLFALRDKMEPEEFRRCIEILEGL